MSVASAAQRGNVTVLLLISVLLFFGLVDELPFFAIGNLASR